MSILDYPGRPNTIKGVFIRVCRRKEEVGDVAVGACRWRVSGTGHRLKDAADLRGENGQGDGFSREACLGNQPG